MPLLQSKRARRLIEAAWPEVRVTSIRSFGEGWANDAWLVNDALLCRFPKTVGAAAAARREMALMPALARVLPLPVPNFRLAAPDGALDFPWPFAAYDLIPGEPASTPGLTVSPKVVPALAGFLSALHRFPAAQAVALGVPGGTTEAWRDEYQHWFEGTLALIAPLLTEVERQQTTSYVTSFLAEAGHFSFEPVLLHRDLSFDHLLISRQTGKLTGVIDFEDAMIGDPAFDFAGLDSLAAAVLAAYKGPADAGLAARAEFYRWLGPLHTLRYGVEAGDQGAVQQGLGRLRQQLGELA